MHHMIGGRSSLLVLILVGVSGWAESATQQSCLLDQLESATAETTVAQLRAACEMEESARVTELPAPAAPPSLFDTRMRSEFDTMGRPFVITPHHPNYMLPLTYNSKVNQASVEPLGFDEPLDKEEVKFQISIKMPLWREIIHPTNDLLFAFTGIAWWQAFNEGFSEPFRESNYEPEVIFRHYGGPRILGLRVTGFDLGFNHQSNGRSGSLSRSWNRVLGSVMLEKGHVALGLRAWYRIPEDLGDDENPHMHRYLGYGQMRAVYAPNRNTFTAMFRPGTEKNAFELTWSYPISEALRIYAQYFNGYGESLVDYNVRTERVGIGVAVNDFLQR